MGFGVLLAHGRRVLVLILDVSFGQRGILDVRGGYALGGANYIFLPSHTLDKDLLPVARCRGSC